MLSISFGKKVDSLQPFKLMGFSGGFKVLLRQAKEELEEKVVNFSDGQSETWGYFPELKPNIKEYPACKSLESYFENEFLGLSELAGLNLQMAFIRLAIREPKSAFGGMHVDVNTGIDHIKSFDYISLDCGILRVLINLSDSVRELKYCPLNLEELSKKDIHINFDHYEVIQLPADIEIKKYSISPISKNIVHGLMFISSDYLHMGVTNQNGHFLLSYGGYVKKEKLKNFFA